MSTILTVYSYHAFKRFLLPAINNADYSILLSSGMFNIKRDVELKLEVIDHVWNFLPSEDYELRFQNGKNMSDGNIIKLNLDGENVVSIIVKQTEDYFSVYKKYRLKEDAVVTIGSSVECDISYGSNLVTKRHARIRVNRDAGYFEDLGSPNGSFVNNLRVNGGILLSFGDCIDIYGLRIVFLGNMLAVNSSECGANVKKTTLSPAVVEAEPVESVLKHKLMKSFHRSPRHIPKIDSEPIGIDESPQPKFLDQPSILMTVAPTLTMVLPMILGSALMIYASNAEGHGTGLYLYSGLITALSSALIGTIWAFVNMREARKKYTAEEAKRNQKYREYLQKKEELIKEKYNRNAMAMRERYKAADECCSYTAGSAELWNRNPNQTDFLYARLGMGDVDFQAEIKVPDEKFTLIDDELAELPARIKKNYAVLHNVPVCIDLLKEQLVGIVGGRNIQGAVDVALSITAQIAANISYTDAKLVIIYDAKKTDLSSSWEFAKWLPHVWNETNTFRYVASNKEEASDVFYEISKKIRALQENSEYSRTEKKIPKPYYIVVLANPEVLEGELVSKYILNPEPSFGITTLYMTENYEDLPNACELVIENSPEFQGIYRVTDDLEDRVSVKFDPVAPALLERLAANIANIEVREVEAGGDVPNSLTFFDMYGINTLAELNVIERWKKNRTYESMKALIGEKSGGARCYLDVHEKYHGPHGLVAGTTGSGKSETLQTYILSMAINFSPDDIGFFIIDYKGGGMGNLFTDLPHMIGQISNLSGNQIRRALVSIKSEKDRRQRIFNEYGVNNINSYTKLYKNNEAKIPVPHMFIVIDEFAEMKRDEPDFIQELVSVSQVGRSLGIHLIMATQKPAGTVDDNIWSNSRFKLCLRVQDRQDSVDMLHRPDAAYITQAGRCYMQVGNDELFELFQSGWSGAPYSEDAAEMKTETAKMLSLNGIPALEGNRAKIERKQEKKRQWIRSLMEIIHQTEKEMGKALPEIVTDNMLKDQLIRGIFRKVVLERPEFSFNEYNERGIQTLIDLMIVHGDDVEAILSAASMSNRKLPELAEITQLDAVIGYLKGLAKTNGYEYDFKLFLPLLGDRIYLSSLPATTLPFNEATSFNGKGWPEHADGWSLKVGMGLYDDPENQKQDTFILDPARSGNILICGSVATGKSTFLQTLLYGLFARYTPDCVQAYIIDFSAKMLSTFEAAPHVGGVMYEEDTEKIAKFFTMLRRLLAARKKLLHGGSFEQYIAVNGNGSLPLILVVIDNYSSFMQKGGITEAMEDFLLQLCKEGVSYGIQLVATAGGIGSNEMPMRVSENYRTTVSLEMTDAMAYGDILRDYHLAVYPEVDVKGRGITQIDGRILEFQTALSLEAESDFERANRIKEVCEGMAAAWAGQKAKQIPEIPAKPVYNEFAELQDYREMLSDKDILPLGYDAEYADVFGVSLRKIYSYIISGGKKKGKTNALKVLAMSASRNGGRVIFIDYSGRCKKFAENAGIEFIGSEKEFYTFLAGVKPEFIKRNRKKHELLDSGIEEENLYDEMQSFEKIYIFIDNLPDFVDKAYASKEDPENIGEYAGFMEDMLNFGSIHNVYWFSALNRKEIGTADGYRLYDLFIQDKKGVHVGGMTDESPMNFDNLPYRLRDQSLPAGRGFLPLDNEDSVTQVVIPLVKGI